MRTGERAFTWRQALWVAAGAVALTFFVAAASWLFSPRPEGRRESSAPAKVTEDTATRQTFVPETVDPGRERPAEGRPAAPQPIEDTPPPAAATAPSVPPSPTTQREEAPAPPPSREVAPPAPPDATPARPAPPPAAAGFGVQVGAYASLPNARDAQGRLSLKGFPSAILSRDGRHKVVVTGFPDRAQAEKAQARIRAAGFDSAFVVALEDR